MSIIEFNEGDRLQSQIADIGWYSARITEMEIKASKQQTSINYWTTFTIDGPKFRGKEIKICYNSASNGSSILGSMHMVPHSDILKVFAAVQNVPLKDVNLQVDTDTLMDKPIDIKLDTAMGDGRPMNILVDYLPAGKGTGAKPSY